MKTKKVLIVSDAGNQNYWRGLTNAITEKIGPVRIVMDKDIPALRFNNSYDLIVVDVSDIGDMHRLIPEIHQKQPTSRIAVISSTPTWKHTREVIRLGAASLIRKSYNPDEVIDELRQL
jgi:DNA-binding NtrC family response regulator